MTKPNEQYQFDLLHMSHNVFEGNRNKYILTGINVASRYKFAEHLRTKKSGEIVYVLGAIYKKGGAFKYPKVFQCDNGPGFKGKATNLFEKHNVDIRSATSKYRHTHTTFVEAFNKELEKLLFKPIDAQELWGPEKVSTISVKNFDPALRRMNNTILSMIGMKPEDAIKLDTIAPDKTCPEETVLPEHELNRYLYQPGEEHGDQKKQATHFIWSTNSYRLDRIVQKPGNCVLHYLQGSPIGFLSVKN